MGTGYDEKGSACDASHSITEWKIELFDKVLHDPSSTDDSGRYVIGDQADIAFFIELAQGWIACERRTLALMKDYLLLSMERDA